MTGCAAELRVVISWLSSNIQVCRSSSLLSHSLALSSQQETSRWSGEGWEVAHHWKLQTEEVYWLHKFLQETCQRLYFIATLLHQVTFTQCYINVLLLIRCFPVFRTISPLALSWSFLTPPVCGRCLWHHHWDVVLLTLLTN